MKTKNINSDEKYFRYNSINTAEPEVSKPKVF